MDFALSDEQRAFRDSVLGFARQHLAAGALARAHDPAHPFDVARLMARQGLLGICMPETEGGQGGGQDGGGDGERDADDGKAHTNAHGDLS